MIAGMGNGPELGALADRDVGVGAEATGAARAGLSSTAEAGLEAASGRGESRSTSPTSLWVGSVPAVGSGIGVKVGWGSGGSCLMRVVRAVSGESVSQTKAVPAPIRAQTSKPNSKPDSGKQARNSPRRGRWRPGWEISR